MNQFTTQRVPDKNTALAATIGGTGLVVLILWLIPTIRPYLDGINAAIAQFLPTYYTDLAGLLALSLVLVLATTDFVTLGGGVVSRWGGLRPLLAILLFALGVIVLICGRTGVFSLGDAGFLFILAWPACLGGLLMAMFNRS